ncbi:NAD-binding protein [Micromonospora sp. NPDC049559]|uniref:NAD-binding protein n=1 Tax=Micromonospora sp. NPDC049559 TaxID=3155923 RepID=UPI00342673DF
MSGDVPRPRHSTPAADATTAHGPTPAIDPTPAPDPALAAGPVPATDRPRPDIPDSIRPASGPARPVEADDGPLRFVVCGDNALARRLVGELMDTYNAHVTVIVRSATANAAPEIVDLRPENGDPALRPVILIAPRLNQEVFRRAGLAEADAVALVSQDDVANVDAALIAREVNPTVRIVVRIFNPVLGEGITAMLGDCGVVSGSEFAAPAFVAAALGEETPTYVRLAGDDVLMAAQRSTVGDDVICGLAITSDDGSEPVRLPEDEDAADLVLVRAYRGAQRPERPARTRGRPLWALRLVFGRNLRLALASLALVLAGGALAFAQARHVNLVEAAYLSVLAALGGADADTGASLLEKVSSVVLVVTGVALVPTVTALVVDAVVNARLKLASGGLIRPVSDHVVVVGLGNVGTRVVRELHEFGVPVVAIDRSAHARGVPVARELGIPVIVADANSAATLRVASAQTARALVALSTDDVTNLETALLARAIHRQHQQRSAPPDATGVPPKLRVVLRLFEEEFAQRVRRAFDINQSRSVSYLAAPAFAAAMMGREVLDTIPVGRRVLLVAELPVGAGSELEGRTCPEVSRPHRVRLIAVRTRTGQTLWSLPPRRLLVRTDRLLVVATRAGLADLLARTAGVADPPPLVEPEPLRLLMAAQQPRRQRPGRPDAEPTSPRG